jgi:Pyridoxamine 5'-phosphate oxidase
MATDEPPDVRIGRPQMPGGYGIAGLDGGELAWSWAAERLSAARNYWVCTTRPDGRPHAMPVWGLWQGDELLFSTDPQSVKARNLADRPQVVVHLESGDDAVIVDGRSHLISASDLPAGFVDDYEHKYTHRIDTSDPSFGFYRVVPSVVLAWREQDFPTSATRFTFGS